MGPTKSSDFGLGYAGSSLHAPGCGDVDTGPGLTRTMALGLGWFSTRSIGYMMD